MVSIDGNDRRGAAVVGGRDVAVTLGDDEHRDAERDQQREVK